MAEYDSTHLVEAIAAMARAVHETEMAAREGAIKRKITDWLPGGLRWLINHPRLLLAYMRLRRVEVVQLEGWSWYRVEIRRRARARGITREGA